jgi:5-methyltetrahydropteroyltriglutamate--homocysteine methyltransferase
VISPGTWPIPAARVAAFVPGIYPRSAGLVQATRDFDRGRTSRSSVAEQLDRDREEFLGVQLAAGLDLVSDGLLDWQDLFRPLADRCENLDARPLARFLDTNTFFRALIASGRPRLREPIPPPSNDLTGWVGTLPSPLTLASAIITGAASPCALAADVLAPQIEAWGRAGSGLIVLEEPFLADTDDGVGLVGGALGELPAEPALVVRLPFTDAGPLLPKLAELPLAGIGVDFTVTQLDALPTGLPMRLVAGVIDARSSRIEDAAELARFGEQLLERGPAGLALVPNGDLQFVPEPIARAKVEQLGRARALLNGDPA